MKFSRGQLLKGGERREIEWSADRSGVTGSRLCKAKQSDSVGVFPMGRTRGKVMYRSESSRIPQILGLSQKQRGTKG